METFKTSKDNPLHKEFGKFSNTIYILKKVREYCPKLLWMMPIGVISSSVMGYYMGFFGKFVIDTVTSGLSYEEKVRSLIIIVCIGGAVALILFMANIFSQNKIWPLYIFVRMRVIEERVGRALHMNYEELEKPEALDIHQRASQATGNNQEGFEGMLHLFEQLAVNVTTVIVTVVSVSVLDFRLVLVLVALALIQYFYFSFCIRNDKKNVWDKLGGTWRQMGYMERATQDFDYAKDIRLYSLQDFLINKQEKIFKNRWKKFDYHQNLWLSHSVIVSIAIMLSKAAVYGVLFMAVLKNDMSIGNFTLYFSLALAFSNSLIEFLRRFGDYGRCSLEVDDFRSFMELDMNNESDAYMIPEADGYEIEFKNVSYKYHGAENYALKNLNLKIKAGERLAVVGLNGAGKTTMIKLLLRLYDPTEGVITLNGTDIRNFRRDDYYKLFSPVFQNIEVLAFPIFENVSMKPTADSDSDKAYKCIEEAGLKERIDGLEKGINTELLKVVDDAGVDFSGGEKQKLALARALYKGAPIVVLDEPTSALDAIAEQNLYERFDNMIGKKSAVYISHRLASTRFCDNVAMFKLGEMIEYGTHDDLMELNGEYANMFNLQAQYYNEKGGKINEEN